MTIHEFGKEFFKNMNKNGGNDESRNEIKW